MHAARLTDIRALTVEDDPVPTPGPGDALIKVAHCALCRTDAKMLTMGHRDLELPRILGHEIYGRVEETSEAVVVWPGVACGECAQCQSGATNLCRAMRIIGFHRDGGLAEYLSAPRRSLVPVPGELPGHLACLAEPLACGINALEQLDLKSGESLLIFGAGPVGLLLAMATKALGAIPAIRDIALDKRDRARPFRRRIETEWFDPSDDRRFEAAVNAAPATGTFIDGLKHLSPGGRFCLFSGLTDGGTIDAAILNEIHYRQLTITGAYGCTAPQIAQALDILAGRPTAAELLIEERIALAAVPTILPKLLSGNHLKIVVDLDQP